MTSTRSPLCLRCRYFDFESEQPPTCEAFPQGIPKAIWGWDHDHTKPYKGDHGIQYEPIESGKNA